MCFISTKKKLYTEVICTKLDCRTTNRSSSQISASPLTDKMNKDWLLVITGISVGCAVTMICTTFLKKIAKLCAGCQPRLASQANCLFLLFHFRCRMDISL